MFALIASVSAVSEEEMALSDVLQVEAEGLSGEIDVTVAVALVPRVLLAETKTLPSVA
jgi:hypothetical protein